MKKILTTLIALAIPAAALADDSKGFYIQGDAGYAVVKDKFQGASGDAKGFSPRLSAGYDFGDFRIAADYTYYKSHKKSERTANSRENYRAKFHSVGVSAIYDFDTQTAFKPYIGARVGLNRVSSHYYHRTSSSRLYTSNKETKAGIGALAGVSYEINRNIALDAGYRYNYWGKYENAKIHSHEFSAGVRVKF